MSSENHQGGGLTHLDKAGRVTMVDVGDKGITSRKARAVGTVLMKKETLARVVGGELKKGDALTLARIAGIMAAKKTADLVPLCHPLALSHVNVTVTPFLDEGKLEIVSDVRCEGRTGVEMEALTAVSAAALTVYDMVKAVDKGVVINGIMLLEKSGGRSGHWLRS